MKRLNFHRYCIAFLSKLDRRTSLYVKFGHLYFLKKILIGFSNTVYGIFNLVLQPDYAFKPAYVAIFNFNRKGVFDNFGKQVYSTTKIEWESKWTYLSIESFVWALKQRILYIYIYKYICCTITSKIYISQICHCGQNFIAARVLQLTPVFLKI